MLSLRIRAAQVVSALAAPILLLSATACSSGGGSSSGPTAAAPSGAGRSTELQTLDAATLPHALLAAADMPGSGWQAQTRANNATTGLISPDTDTFECDTALKTPNGGDGSYRAAEDVTGTDGTTYSVTLLEYPSADTAAGKFGYLGSMENGCTTARFVDAGGSGTVQFTKAQAPQLGDASSAVSVRIQGSGAKAVSGTLVVIRVGPTLILVEPYRNDLSAPAADPSVLSKAVQKYTQTAMSAS